MIVYEDMCVGCPQRYVVEVVNIATQYPFTSAIDVKTIMMIAYTYMIMKSSVMIVFMTK